ncbi:hypothetical protein GUA87_04885 [Sneathiella sp. P13V-1]|uniref:hypothetical protein n=1 Tax=Sneathiella sp. P13V-1 TaxID=2697366 RepID=UPI00187B8C47|nr:hypothetical protein [Sneathiella sp. P13V-1]MBE7636169.1 hypothetical protein [Sneathiella sp. P13V-1]
MRHEKRQRRLWASSVALSVFLLPAYAQAEINWPETISATGETGQFVIALDTTSDEWGARTENLIIEIDNVDVTELVAFTPAGFRYEVLQPLKVGLHTLKIYEADQAGDYQLVREYQFEATADQAGVASGGSLTLESDNSLEISQRLFETNITSSIDDTTASGAGNTSIRYENGGWSLNINSNYFLESEEEISQTGNEFDLGEYDARLAYSGDGYGAEVNLGHHDVGLESLAFSGFNRRGVSLKTSFLDDAIQITGFSLSSDSLAGVDDISGQKEDSGYVAGGAVAIRPLWNEIGKIELTGVYFDSKGGEADFGSGGGLGVDAAPKGQGAALIADTLWYEDRLRVRGEYAYSNMDLDGDDAALDKDSANAHAYSLDYDLIRDDGTHDTPTSLKIGARYERIDTYYYSLANSGLATDRDGFTAYANMYYGSFNLNALSSVFVNNVDDHEDLATDRVITASLDGSYSFDPQVNEEGEIGWLGTPFMGFGVNYMDANRVDTPVGYLGDDTNNHSGTLYFNFGSSYETWNWQLGYNHALFVDDTNVSSDTANDLIDLSAYWNVSDYTSLSVGAQLNRYEQKADSERTYSVSGNLGLQTAFIPDVLNARLDYNMNLSSGSNDIPDRHLLATEVEWTLIPAEINSAGVALAFRGAMEKQHGNEDSSLDDAAYEGFFVLKFKAPLLY